MDSTTKKCTKREVNRGVAWTAEEDQRLAQVVEVHGPKRWRSVAAKAGLNRCGKSCRLRWMNYLRPNIKRGNISDQEEDLIVRLHKLLGNRWSLIAGRLPGRTDNEIKNYWNSHLCKKLKQKEKQSGSSTSMHIVEINVEKNKAPDMNATTEGTTSEEGSSMRVNEPEFGCGGNDEFFDLQFNQAPRDLEWISKFLVLDETWFNNPGDTFGLL